jgi:hypothetical protein
MDQPDEAAQSAADWQAEVTSRYEDLARAAQAGERIVDCGEDAFTEGQFGSAGYDQETSDLPEGAVRASLGCGNPAAVAPLAPGQKVLDLGSGGGIDVHVRVDPAGGRVA